MTHVSKRKEKFTLIPDIMNTTQDSLSEMTVVTLRESGSPQSFMARYRRFTEWWSGSDIPCWEGYGDSQKSFDSILVMVRVVCEGLSRPRSSDPSWLCLKQGHRGSWPLKGKGAWAVAMASLKYLASFWYFYCGVHSSLSGISWNLSLLPIEPGVL